MKNEDVAPIEVLYFSDNIVGQSTRFVGTFLLGIVVQRRAGFVVLKIRRPGYGVESHRIEVRNSDLGSFAFESLFCSFEKRGIEGAGLHMGIDDQNFHVTALCHRP